MLEKLLQLFEYIKSLIFPPFTSEVKPVVVPEPTAPTKNGLYLGLDALEILTPFISKIKAAEISFVMRYLKNLSKAEAQALSDADLLIGAIFETTATRAFGGTANGSVDGKTAFLQAQALGMPKGSAIFATVDEDVTPENMDAVINYFAAFDAAIWPTYSIGGYACGNALTQLRLHGLVDPWLAGAMGWSGSKTYTDWVIKQGPELRHGGKWGLLDWPDLGFPYDPNVATTLKCGLFKI